jgi:hypothetical protein
MALAERVIENSVANPVVLEAVTRFGYDEAEFAEGRALLESFRTKYHKTLAKRGKKEAATIELREVFDELKVKIFSKHVRIAREVVFQGDAKSRRRLRIHRSQPRLMIDYLPFIETFYRLLLENEDLLAKVSKHGLNAERIADAQEDLARLAELHRGQQDLITRAQVLHMQRDERRRALAEWLAGYQKVARYALAHVPDHLKQFGLRVAAS